MPLHLMANQNVGCQTLIVEDRVHRASVWDHSLEELREHRAGNTPRAGESRLSTQGSADLNYSQPVIIDHLNYKQPVIVHHMNDNQSFSTAHINSKPTVAVSAQQCCVHRDHGESLNHVQGAGQGLSSYIGR